MKNIKIFSKDWLQLHPYTQSDETDLYYTYRNAMPCMCGWIAIGNRPTAWICALGPNIDRHAKYPQRLHQGAGARHHPRAGPRARPNPTQRLTKALFDSSELKSILAKFGTWKDALKAVV